MPAAEEKPERRTKRVNIPTKPFVWHRPTLDLDRHRQDFLSIASHNLAESVRRYDHTPFGCDKEGRVSVVDRLASWKYNLTKVKE